MAMFWNMLLLQPTSGDDHVDLSYNYNEIIKDKVAVLAFSSMDIIFLYPLYKCQP